MMTSKSINSFDEINDLVNAVEEADVKSKTVVLHPDEMSTTYKTVADFTQNESGKDKEEKLDATLTDTFSGTYEEEGSSFAETNVQTSGNLAVAQSTWERLILQLRVCGNEIGYEDIYELTMMREPNASIVLVLSYIATLLGLKNDWATIKGTLLKESRIFQNFIRQVSIAVTDQSNE